MPRMLQQLQRLARRSVRCLPLCLLPIAAQLPAREPEHAPLRAEITVDAARPIGKISPLLYGQFLEHMFQCIKTGLHAELVRNRGFEEPADHLGLPRDWEPYPDRRNDDPIQFAWDAGTSYPDRINPDTKVHERSLRVDVQRGPASRHGVCQSGIPAVKGAQYEGYVWLKAADYHGPIQVTLEPEIEGAPPYAEAELEAPSDHWNQHRFRFRASASDPLARLVFRFGGRGRVWMDAVSLLPGSAVDGVRQDVFQRIQDLRPAFVRWPGGNVAQDYRWLWGVGPRDQRVTWTNLSCATSRSPQISAPTSISASVGTWGHGRPSWSTWKDPA